MSIAAKGVDIDNDRVFLVEDNLCLVMDFATCAKHSRVEICVRSVVGILSDKNECIDRVAYLSRESSKRRFVHGWFEWNKKDKYNSL